MPSEKELSIDGTGGLMERDLILCVDDESMVVDALKMELMQSLSSEFIIESARSGEEALEIAQEAITSGDHIILVISDQRMPGMTGEVLLSKLNAIIPQSLKILLTGYTDIEAVQYAINHAGLYRYIQKPWDRQDLVLTVSEAVDKYRTQKKLEEKTRQVIRMNEELEKMVEQRTLQLSDAIKELESFSYTVSHDLKSPLRSIDYYAKFILEDYEKTLGEDVASMLKNIRSVCSGMFDLIDKLLLYAVTAKAEPEFSMVDMNSLFEQTFNEMMVAEQGRNIELKIDSNLPEVKADCVLIKQVVHNLLSNAVKFTRQKEEAVIRITCVKETGTYCFSVSDNGVGFNMNYAHKLFGLFQRMHSHNRFEGSGIGLATVKKIIEKHGGKVSISSEEGRGTQVSFALPLTHEERDG